MDGFVGVGDAFAASVSHDYFDASIVVFCM